MTDAWNELFLSSLGKLVNNYGQTWEEGKMVYASSANPSGKGNRGKVEGIGQRASEGYGPVIGSR